MRKPSYTAPIAIGAISLGILAGMNIISQKNAPKTDAELQAEAREVASANATPSPNVPAVQPPQPGSSADLVLTDGLKEIGPKDAKQTVVVGYEWTPEIQADPSKIQSIVTKLEKAAPGARIALKNVDENPDVPVGIQVNGKVVAPIGEDGSVSAEEIPAVIQALGAK